MIAISYRRDDSSPAAGRLYDRLQAEFGQGNVFMDFDSIPYGVDFREKIKQTLEGAQVVIAVIGPNWMGSRGRGKRRINDPADFVRLEIAQALLRGIPVIPVLLDNTLMPKVESLPEDIRGLAYRNALALDTGVDFHHHANRLISGIRKFVVLPAIVAPNPVPPPPPRPTADVQPPSISPPPLAVETKPSADHRRRKMILAAVVFIALVILVSLWSLVSSIGRAIREKRGSDLGHGSSPPTVAVVSASPSSIATTFKADALTPEPSPVPSPTPPVEPTASAAISVTAPATATATPATTPEPMVMLAQTPFPTPAWTPAPELISMQEAQVFVNAYYRTVERKDMDSLLSFFDDTIVYHTDTMVGKAAVKDDYTRYFKRWPVASFSIGEITIRRASAPDKVVLLFEIRYSVRDPASKRSRTGRAEETWTLERIDGVPKITSQQEIVHPDPLPKGPSRR
ncbi:MAG TPA: TIR domain-containing protein [Chthoniobacterales bacterium]|nr:TIR domain-containing protein [Chthoniobacterales bacterium]